MKKVEATMTQLDKKVLSARPSFPAKKTVLYANEETGTVIYQIYTDNSSVPDRFEFVSWTNYLVGNEYGYADVGFHVSSEANFRLGEIHEDNENIIIPRSGFYTIIFDIRVDAEDLVVKKSDLKPYEEPEKKSSEKTKKGGGRGNSQSRRNKRRVAG
jgi:hypothetical protein